MASPTTALLWAIWRQHRGTVAAIAAVTVAGRLFDVVEPRTTADIDPSPLTVLCAMAAFLLLFAVFNVTESTSSALGQFPRRLFTLPVSALRLVAVPMLAAIASVELLYFFWREPFSRGGTASVLFVAVLLAAMMVMYLAALWMLERAGSLRLIVFGAIVSSIFTIGMLPSFPGPRPLWRSEPVLAGLVTASAVIAFLLALRHVRRLRSGGSQHVLRVEALGDAIGKTPAARRTSFKSPAAAQFWFEWRSSGLVLPGLVAGQMLFLVMPVSWLRNGADDTLLMFFAALAAPIVLAIPTGIAVSKPTLRADDFRVPAFLAVRPFSAEEFVAVKVKVAALSAVLSWAVLLILLTIWLSTWATLDSLSRVAIQLWAFHEGSVAAVYGIAALTVIAGFFLTWRFLVSRLWSGLTGMRPLLTASVVAIFLLGATAMVAVAGDALQWLFADPARLAPVAWAVAAAVIVKFWLAAYTWRGVPAAYLRNYLLMWLAGTAAILTLGLVIWRIARIYLPTDADRLQGIVVLLALLAMPLARVGLAPVSLTWNRHRKS